MTAPTYMKAPTWRGGARKGAGLHPSGEKQPRRNITLSDRLAEKAKRVGGTVSEGIRIALGRLEDPGDS